MEFRERVGELAVPAWKELLGEEVIESYARLEVMVPVGATAPYDVIASTQFKNQAAFDAAKGLFSAKLKEMFPERNVPQEATAVRYPMLQEILTAEEIEIGPQPARIDGNVVAVKIIKVESSAAEAYHNVVQEFLLPLYRQLMKNGVVESHSRFQLSEPLNSSMDANYLILSRFKDVSVWAGFRGMLLELGRELFPHRDLELEYLSHCKVIRTELACISHAVSRLSR